MTDYFTSLARRNVLDGGVLPRRRTSFEPIPLAGGDAAAETRPEQSAKAGAASGTVGRATHNDDRRAYEPDRARYATFVNGGPPVVDLAGEASSSSIPSPDRGRTPTKEPLAALRVTGTIAAGPRAPLVAAAHEPRPPSLPRLAMPAGAERSAEDHPPPRGGRARRAWSIPPTRPAAGPDRADIAEPTIRIHIGRVDVRAMAPVASAAAASRAAHATPGPALTTLEDYVRQRREGGS